MVGSFLTKGKTAATVSRIVVFPIGGIVSPFKATKENEKNGPDANSALWPIGTKFNGAIIIRWSQISLVKASIANWRTKNGEAQNGWGTLIDGQEGTEDNSWRRGEH
jgi:hypothetical protein